MRHCSTLILAALLTCAWLPGAFAADKAAISVVDSKGVEVPGTAVTANDAGDVTLTLQGGASRTFKAGEYGKVTSPKPELVGNAETALDQKKYDDVLKALTPEVFAKNRFLGWGGRIANLRASVYLARAKTAPADKAADPAKLAETAVRDGLPAARRDGTEGLLKRNLVEALYYQGRKDDARKALDDVALDQPEDEAFASNMRGRFLEDEAAKPGTKPEDADKKRKEAVLKHLSVVLLYENVPDVREDSLRHVITLLKALRDVRAGEFEKILAAGNAASK